MRVAVIGAGKMGLPLACQFATRGATVIACDVKAALVESINRGICPIDEPGVPAMLADAVQRGRLWATTDIAAAVAESQAVVVIVPALLTSHQDIDPSALVNASMSIAKALRPGTIVSYETTLPVGGTRCYLLPVLEQSGLKAGVDFDLIYSPERVKSRLVLAHMTQTPKIVGGITPAAALRGTRFYEDYLGSPTINVGSLEAAEMVKLAGMVYRDVNIALANELARYAVAVGVDLPAVIDAANTDGDTQMLRPGIGVGGHCTPVYPYFLIRDAEKRGIRMTLAERSRTVNDGQVNDTLNRLERTWGRLTGRHALVLGLAFRPNVKEHILSPAFRLRDELIRRGAEVRLHDPLYSDAELQQHGFVPGSIDGPSCAEVIVLQTAHPLYASMPFERLASAGTQIVVDGRGFWLPEQVRAAGLIYLGIDRADDATSRARSRIAKSSFVTSN